MHELYTPRFYHRCNDRDRQTLKDLEITGRVRTKRDLLRQQILNLALVRDPARWRARPMSQQDEDVAIETVLAGRTLDEYGVDVYMPWNQALARILPRDDHDELRTARNRNKLTHDEQRRLSQLKLGVAGMSSGGVIAMALALGGLCGELRLADFDTLDTTNLNRLPAGIHELAMNKAVFCARRILENNPYQQVTVFQEGITADNATTFLDGGGKLDIVIEQMDNLAMKMHLRKKARERGIIVLMETNDLGRLDVERFDLEPRRALLHGLLGTTADENLEELDDQRKMKIILDILQQRPSERLAECFSTAGSNISGWPQLAHEVLLGAATVSHAVRRIGIGQPLPSGRYSANLDHMLATTMALQTPL